MSDHHPASSIPPGPGLGLNLGAPIGGNNQDVNVDDRSQPHVDLVPTTFHPITTTTATSVSSHAQPHSIVDPQPSSTPAYHVPLTSEPSQPTRPTTTRRQTPRPYITRTPSSYIDHPPSPPLHQHGEGGAGTRFLKSQRELEEEGKNEWIVSGTAVQPDYQVEVKERARDKRFGHSTVVTGEGNTWAQGGQGSPHDHPSTAARMAQPASTLQDHSSSSPLSTQAQSNVLPTSRTTHPEEQRRALQGAGQGGEKDEVVGRELEKAEADRRGLRGDDVGGKIVEGIEDDQLYALLRRFDQDVTHTLLLTSIRPLPLSQPDLRRSVLPNVPYSTDILKSNLERLYASGGTGVTRGLGELMRLRSWEPRERRRTAWFAGTYALAWVLGLAIPTLVGFLIVLVVSPESRLIFFPPIPPPPGQPPSAFDPTNQRGDQTLLGGTDSALTHKSVSEQKEEAAWEFRNLAETFAVKLAVSSGKSRAQGNADLGEKEVDDEKDSDATSVTSIDSDDDFLDARDDQVEEQGGMIITSDMYAPGEHPTELIRQNKRSRGIYTGDDGEANNAGMSGKTMTIRDPRTGKKKGEKPLSDSKRKKQEAKEAKLKRDELVGKYLKLLQDGLGDAADMSEILINALKPPPPYPPMIDMARYKLAGAILLPILLATAFMPSWIWARGASFTLGFLFFGQPVIDRGIKLFIQKVPNWQEYLDMRNSLLYGVPTNDQLVLHLLRVGERQGVPLPRPPPPPLAGTPKEQIKDNAPDPENDLVDENGNPIDVSDLGVKDKAMHKSKSKIVGGLKSLSKRVAGIGADVTVDGVKKQVGSKVDRMIWGDMLKDDGDPESYPCRLNGHNGHLVISPMSGYGVPTIAFHTSALGDKHEWIRDINDIVEIKKVGISVPRAVLGWASGADIESQTLLVRMKSRQDRSASEVDDTIEVKGMNSNEGDSYEFQAVGRREQLFVRLLSMGNQRWESL